MFYWVLGIYFGFKWVSSLGLFSNGFRISDLHGQMNELLKLDVYSESLLVPKSSSKIYALLIWLLALQLS